MDRFKFRAWSITDKCWVYGSLNAYNDGKRMITNFEGRRSWFVKPETVGQFTGLKDKNGTDIYVGDKIRYASNLECGDGEIEWNTGFIIIWDLKTVKSERPTISSPLYYFQCSAELEIIGNIHQNPDLC